MSSSVKWDPLIVLTTENCYTHYCLLGLIFKDNKFKALSLYLAQSKD